MSKCMVLFFASFDENVVVAASQFFQRLIILLT